MKNNIVKDEEKRLIPLLMALFDNCDAIYKFEIEREWKKNGFFKLMERSFE